jgi:chromosomal replication initiation ATPase DnaA
MVGKDHTTVMHSRKQFNKLQYFHQDKVAAVDSLMGYEPR